MNTVTLHAKGASAVISLRGAEILSYKDKNSREFLWQGADDVWPQHAPVLFPVCGTPLNRAVTINGVSYPMPQHGFAMTSDFEISAQSDDSVDLVLRANDTTRTMYPFEFALHVIYTIQADGYETKFIVVNESQQDMPFCIGGHPGIVCPMEDGAYFEDYQLEFDMPEIGWINKVIDGGLIDGVELAPNFQYNCVLPLDYSLINSRDTLLFNNLNSRGAKLMHYENRRGIRINFPDFPALAVWTSNRKRAPYVCLEPWLGLPGSPNESGVLAEKPWAVTLAPGQMWEGSFSIMNA